ncbi:MAG: MFS transporter [Bacteroidetes bacterium GWF2_40_14]|nr:MAG: MFS transporter [Bacteroidetes bacterium GWF2_40_14]
MTNNWKRVFAIIWTGQLFSTLSSSVVSFAVIFWLSVQTGSAEVLAFATLASLLPQLVFGLFTGVLVDRWDRKRTMIVADLYIAALTSVMAVLFYFGATDIELIYLLLALRSIGSAFHMPAMEASVPLLAPATELMRVAGVNNMIFSVSTIAAPAIAAIFVSTLSMTWVLMFDVIGALIACGSLLFVVIPNPGDKTNGGGVPGNVDILDEKDMADDGHIAEVSTRGIRAEFRRFFWELNQGLHEIIKRPGLMWMFVFTIFASLAMVPVSTLFPLMTLSHFAGDTYKMSMVEIAWGVGMLIGGGLMSLPRFKFNKILLINAMYVILGLTFVFSGFLPSEGFYLFVSFTLFGGIAGAIFWGAFTVLLQMSLDSAVLGRVFSIHNSLIMIPAMLSLIATGYIADSIGISNTFIISGFVLVLIGIISNFIPSIKKMAQL